MNILKYFIAAGNFVAIVIVVALVILAVSNKVPSLREASYRAAIEANQTSGVEEAPVVVCIPIPLFGTNEGCQELSAEDGVCPYEREVHLCGYVSRFELTE